MGSGISEKCPNCNEIRPTQKQFIFDRQLELNGSMADFEKLEYGLFLFTHNLTDRRSTMAIRVCDFMNLYTGPMYKERKTGTEECPGYCLDSEQLSRCEAMCECAFSRENIHIIRMRKGEIDPSGC